MLQQLIRTDITEGAIRRADKMVREKLESWRASDSKHLPFILDTAGA